MPFPLDLAASLSLAEAALRSRLAPGEQLDDFLPTIASGIRTGTSNGGLLRAEGIVQGIVTWEPAGPYGVGLRLLYLTPSTADAEGYRSALEAAEKAAGPIAFLSGPLAGLTPEEESTLLRGRGFAPFGRLEMVLPPTAPAPATMRLTGVEIRPLRGEDEPRLARLHERAYQDHLDRFLATEEPDPGRDADRQLRDYFTGRYGEVLSPGSSVAVQGGELVAAAIATRYTGRVLFVDIMTDPGHQGLGLGRAVLGDAVRALRLRNESSIVLNVTEGNERALRLYARLGFVRSLGPTREWYDARRMRVLYPPDGPR